MNVRWMVLSVALTSMALLVPSPSQAQSGGELYGQSATTTTAVQPESETATASTAGGNRTWDPTLFIVGATTFGVTWIATWVSTLGVCGSGCEDATIGTSFIPIAGGILAAEIENSRRYHDLALGLGIATALAQTAGLVMMIVGLVSNGGQDASETAHAPRLQFALAPLPGGALGSLLLDF